MDSKQFESRIQVLLPDAYAEAMQKLISYAQELDQDGTYQAADFFDEAYAELVLINQHDGEKTARQLFDAGRFFTFNPFEMRGAARFFKAGMLADTVYQKALAGFCDRTPQERLESHNMLEAIRNPRYDMGNIVSEQDRKTPLDKKLIKFSKEQASLIREIVEKTILDAVTGAEADEAEDEENMYCEIDYDKVYARLSLLDDMGVSLTVEKLSEFLDAHPAVDYTDAHNTGITIYLNDPEILQELGLLPKDGGQELRP